MAVLPQYLNKASKQTVEDFLNSFDTVFTDCDGVLWHENEVIHGSETTLNKLRSLGKNVYFITNNSSKTREQFVTKCQKLGFIANRDDILSTAYLAAEYLHGIKFDKKVYVIGSKAIAEELDKFGIRHTDIGPHVMDSSVEDFILTRMKLDPEVGAVLVGLDEHFSYPKLLLAVNYLKNPDCLFVATNSDENAVVPNFVLPGAGSLVRCVETASGRKAFCVGKPSEYIKKAVERNYKINSSRTLMIGDKCNTDILFGKRCGFKTLLVMSGVTTHEEVRNFAASSEESDHLFVPQYCIEKLGDLLRFIS